MALEDSVPTAPLRRAAVGGFREPCYWGETAGSEVYFKAVDIDFLVVASLYTIWKKTAKTLS